MTSLFVLKMKVERTKDEIVVRLPSSKDLSELEDILDYPKYRELTANSNAKQEDVDKLAKAVNSAMWKKVKKRKKS